MNIEINMKYKIGEKVYVLDKENETIHSSEVECIKCIAIPDDYFGALKYLYVLSSGEDMEESEYMSNDLSCMEEFLKRIISHRESLAAIEREERYERHQQELMEEAEIQLRNGKINSACEELYDKGFKAGFIAGFEYCDRY